MRRVLIAAAAAITLAGLIAAAAPATAGQRAARPDSVCQGNGAGCTKAGTYPSVNALINSDYNGFRVVWTSSVVKPYSSGVPLYWTANVTYTNVTSQTLDLGCPGSWTDPAYVSEQMSGGSGDDGGVAASSTLCSDDPGLTAAIPPGGSTVSDATFHNVPWPGSSVALVWGDAGTSAAVNPFTPPSPVPPCTINPILQCQSLNPTVAVNIDYWGDAPTCVFTWNVNWGDGTSSQNLVVTGPPDGEVPLTKHTYTRQGTFTIAVTGSESTGNCVVDPFTATFTSLAYAALGDSYSAGVGADDVPRSLCHRTDKSYTVPTDMALGQSGAASEFNFAACSGAVIKDFDSSQMTGVAPQIDVLRNGGAGRIGLVTFTIGGNDANFAGVMKYCATRGPKDESCQDKFSKEVTADLASIKTELPVLFDQIKTAPGLAPGARVLVVGYPLFFDPQWLPPNANTQTCLTGWLTYTFSNSDMAWIDTSITKLDGILGDAAAAAGFTYVDNATAFNGHYLCEPKPDLHGAIWPPFARYESYHPTAPGYVAITARVENALGIG